MNVRKGEEERSCNYVCGFCCCSTICCTNTKRSKAGNLSKNFHNHMNALTGAIGKSAGHQLINCIFKRARSFQPNSQRFPAPRSRALCTHGRERRKLPSIAFFSSSLCARSSETAFNNHSQCNTFNANYKLRRFSF